MKTKFARLFTVIILSIFSFINTAIAEGDYPFVEQTIDCVSVAHLEDRINIIFFWDIVQGEFELLDYKWEGRGMHIYQDNGYWTIYCLDESDNCYRIIRAKVWIESWEYESPLAENGGKPWFAQRILAGLKQPPKK